jgi:hypothetical protein
MATMRPMTASGTGTTQAAAAAKKSSDHLTGGPAENLELLT